MSCSCHHPSSGHRCLSPVQGPGWGSSSLPRKGASKDQEGASRSPSDLFPDGVHVLCISHPSVFRLEDLQAGREELSRSCTPMGRAGPASLEGLGDGEGPRQEGGANWRLVAMTLPAMPRSRESFHSLSALSTWLQTKQAASARFTSLSPLWLLTSKGFILFRNFKCLSQCLGI